MTGNRYTLRHLVDSNGYGFSRIYDQERGKPLAILDTRDKWKARRMVAALNEAARRAAVRREAERDAAEGFDATFADTGLTAADWEAGGSVR